MRKAPKNALVRAQIQRDGKHLVLADHPAMVVGPDVTVYTPATVIVVVRLADQLLNAQLAGKELEVAAVEDMIERLNDAAALVAQLPERNMRHAHVFMSELAISHRQLRLAAMRGQLIARDDILAQQ